MTNSWGRRIFARKVKSQALHPEASRREIVPYCFARIMTLLPALNTNLCLSDNYPVDDINAVLEELFLIAHLYESDAETVFDGYLRKLEAARPGLPVHQDSPAPMPKDFNLVTW